MFKWGLNNLSHTQSNLLKVLSRSFRTFFVCYVKNTKFGIEGLKNVLTCLRIFQWPLEMQHHLNSTAKLLEKKPFRKKRCLFEFNHFWTEQSSLKNQFLFTNQSTHKLIKLVFLIKNISSNIQLCLLVMGCQQNKEHKEGRVYFSIT
jgi:hypothetical protein